MTRPDRPQRPNRPRGRPPHPDILTPAEWRVLDLIRAGHSNPEIAARLGVSVHTVKTQVSSMLSKLDLQDRAQLAAWHGEPVEASRSALARFALAAPLAWVRDTLGAPWLGKTALVGGLAAVGIGAIIALNSINQNGEGVADPSPTAPPAATASPTATEPPAAATTPPDPTPPPMPELRIEVPPADHPGIGLVDGLPPGAVGPLVAYVHTSPEGAGARREREIRVFDVGAGQPVSSFTLGSSYDVSPHLVGRHIHGAFGTAIWRFNLDGTDGREIYASQDHLVYWGGVSPDGTLLAVTDEHYASFIGPREPRRIVAVNIATGDVVLEEEQTFPEWEPFQLLAHAVGWTGNNAVLVHGVPPTHGPAGGTALVHLDGTIEVLSADQHLEPGTRQLRRLDGFDPICGYGGAARIEVIEGVPPDVVVGVEADGPFIEFTELSPDSSEMLYLLRLGDEETAASLRDLIDNATCASHHSYEGPDPETLPHEWRVQDIATGEARVTTSRLEVLREWYGSRLITFACAGDEVGGVGPDNAYAPVGGSAAWTFSDAGCDQQHESRELELRVAGLTIDTGYHFQVLGFIEVP